MAAKKDPSFLGSCGLLPSRRPPIAFLGSTKGLLNDEWFVADGCFMGSLNPAWRRGTTAAERRRQWLVMTKKSRYGQLCLLQRLRRVVSSPTDSLVTDLISIRLWKRRYSLKFYDNFKWYLQWKKICLHIDFICMVVRSFFWTVPEANDVETVLKPMVAKFSFRLVNSSKWPRINDDLIVYFALYRGLFSPFRFSWRRGETPSGISTFCRFSFWIGFTKKTPLQAEMTFTYQCIFSWEINMNFYCS